LEKFYKQGVLKAIGISNFNEKQIQDLYDKAEVKPQNLQVKFFWIFKGSKPTPIE
jgi:diketogulonate reductase-like aldo/keto reductase